MLDDINVDARYRDKNIRRMDYFIPSYLLKFINKNDVICSMGCGTGYDVELLNSLGYDAYGIDPGNRIKDWKNRPIEIQKKLKVGSAGDFPFGDKKFDFIYSLEVIEHVGCKDGIWELLDNYIDSRKEFSNSCIDMLNTNGRLFISTSNRLFPIDFGHAHHYNKLSNYFSKYGLNITIPWHKRNFLLSFNDICNLLDKDNNSEKYKIAQISSLGYPSNSSNKYGKIANILTNILLYTLSIYPLIRINPILVVHLTKL